MRLGRARWWVLLGLAVVGVMGGVVVPVGCGGTPEPIDEKPADPAARDARTAQLALAGTEEFTPAALEDAIAFLEGERAWDDHTRPLDVPRHPAEKYLEGWVIVLDPGHGGKGDVPGYKAGPTGVREAEMNLRVSKLLRKMLEDAGAYVALTREGEISDIADDRIEGTLRMRAEFANDIERPDGGTGADVFISVHHNASSRDAANFPSVWFHGEADWSEPALDIAKYVGHRLGAEMRNEEVGLTSVLMSDRQMYSGGFGVLRHSEVPAILLESSFFSHPTEEQRLRDAMHNLREAYAVYVGLVEYAYGGRPTQSPPEVATDGDELVITTTLSEGLPQWWGHDRQRTLSSTIAVYVDGQRVPAEYDPATKVLTARADVGEWVGGEVRVHHQNLYKHSNWPQRYAVRLGNGAYDVSTLGSMDTGELAAATADPVD
ncbi:MAG: N-acetylmuramoyl-L-alanine amidase [Planctomycetota bacterium]